jgi:hypothetical protein
VLLSGRHLMSVFNVFAPSDFFFYCAQIYASEIEQLMTAAVATDLKVSAAATSASALPSPVSNKNGGVLERSGLSSAYETSLMLCDVM